MRCSLKPNKSGPGFNSAAKVSSRVTRRGQTSFHKIFGTFFFIFTVIENLDSPALLVSNDVEPTLFSDSLRFSLFLPSGFLFGLLPSRDNKYS